jgi:hypothetical protein
LLSNKKPLFIFLGLRDASTSHVEGFALRNFNFSSSSDRYRSLHAQSIEHALAAGKNALMTFY